MDHLIDPHIFSKKIDFCINYIFASRFLTKFKYDGSNLLTGGLFTNMEFVFQVRIEEETELQNCSQMWGLCFGYVLTYYSSLENSSIYLDGT